jgi:hypothetical protein
MKQKSPDKITVIKLAKKCSAIYGTWSFITTFIAANYWTISPASLKQFTRSRLISVMLCQYSEPGSSVSIVSGYGLDDWAIEVRSSAEAIRFFPVASVSRPALRPTQPPVQWVPGVLFPGVKRGRSVRLTTHPIYCRGPEWVEAIPPLHPSAFVACSGTALALC